jgi:tetratricopeptide (TPR) repeat protein
MLVELLPWLLRVKQSWALYERIELYTVLGGCYVALQKWDHAEMFLFKAIDGHLANEHAHYRKVARCMEEIAKFYEASSNNEYAHEARRVALSVLAAEERDAGRLALAEIELARAEVRIGGKHSAVARYTAAIRTLRKRKAIVAREALPAARMELASLVQPTKRLRTKTLPEEC